MNSRRERGGNVTSRLYFSPLDVIYTSRYEGLQIKGRRATETVTLACETSGVHVKIEVYRSLLPPRSFRRGSPKSEIKKRTRVYTSHQRSSQMSDHGEN